MSPELFGWRVGEHEMSVTLSERGGAPKYDGSDDILNDLEEYDWEVNNFEDLTQSDCDHNCSPTPDLDISKLNLLTE